ncbi:hypothetical protein RV10_GL001573 [Enterococcus pallens]|nr:hypothetical protein RV10_GL001573 [Enterococcus pallens]
MAENDVIRRYQTLKARVDENTSLHTLQEEIQQAQKDAVQFAHYGKPAAEKEALKQADSLTDQLNQHPLVTAYREQLGEANDLLHHLTSMIQTEINQALEEEQ